MTKEQRTHNIGLAKVAVQCSADTFVVNQTLVFQIKFCGKSSAHRKSAKPLNSELFLQFPNNFTCLRLPGYDVACQPLAVLGGA